LSFGLTNPLICQQNTQPYKDHFLFPILSLKYFWNLRPRPHHTRRGTVTVQRHDAAAVTRHGAATQYGAANGAPLFSRHFAVDALERPCLDMDRERIILLLLLRRRMKKKQKQRKFWVNPYISTMNPDGGHFKRKYAALKLSGNEKFFDYFRMTIPTFEELLTNIAPRLQKRFVFRKPVDPMEMLGLTIR
jgi:hypothetical protein